MSGHLRPIELSAADARRVRTCAFCKGALPRHDDPKEPAQPWFRDAGGLLRAACWSCVSGVLQVAFASPYIVETVRQTTVARRRVMARVNGRRAAAAKKAGVRR